MNHLRISISLTNINIRNFSVVTPNFRLFFVHTQSYSVSNSDRKNCKKKNHYRRRRREAAEGAPLPDPPVVAATADGSTLGRSRRRRRRRRRRRCRRRRGEGEGEEEGRPSPPSPPHPAVAAPCRRDVSMGEAAATACRRRAVPARREEDGKRSGASGGRGGVDPRFWNRKSSVFIRTNPWISSWYTHT